MKSKLMKTVSILIVTLVMVLCSVPAQAAYTPDFDLQSETVLLLNMDTGKVMYEKNADARVYPASLTKIMTAILALENVEDLDGTKVALKQYIQDMLYGKNASLGGILLGEEVSMRGLLYASMLQSANEASLMIGDYLGDGSLTQFAEMMNDKAKELGCTGTNFVNPNGLHDENHYTTARDMAKIAAYAMQNPEFVEIVNTVSMDIGPTNKHEQLVEITTNKVIVPSSIYYNPAVSGIKTGTLDEAGRCFVSTATKDGFTYLLVLMGAPFYNEDGTFMETMINFEETNKLYDWVFDSFKVKTVMEKGRYIADVPVRLSYEKDVVGLVADARLTALIPADVETSSVQLVPTLPESIDAPVKKGDKVGSVKLVLAGEELGEVDLVANESVEMSKILYYYDQAMELLDSFWAKFAILFVALLVVAYIALMILMNKHNRKRRMNQKRRRNL
ncbi:MAG: D-alanyl-D-alanine carboxypeptidase [Oscillospiraceae bacterium]|nr:D-alanyl-D-alanine carboxypeptidase [Oscillospiraceae bacterium]MBQ8670202.1 D-alanyl-D-alanine carboxypeptidase [Oscillospiraceae bacterium]MBQ9109231.1 D-alanyl-D-alanine carboxypeptidase [Oscillospiraceae bacterium]